MTTSEYECSGFSKKCPGGLQCITMNPVPFMMNYELCDGIEDCNDGSDESVDLCEGLQFLLNLTCKFYSS